MVIRNHSADRPACFCFANSLAIPVDSDGSVVVVDEKGSIGANHASVYMVVKLGTAFSLASRSSEGTQPGCSYGSYGSRGCDPQESSKPTARHQSPMPEQRKFSVLEPK